MKTSLITTLLFICLAMPFSESLNAADIMTSEGTYIFSYRDPNYTIFPSSINFPGYTLMNGAQETITSCDPIALPNSCANLVTGDVVTITYGLFNNPSQQAPLLTIQDFSDGEATGTAFSRWFPEVGVTDNTFVVTLNGQPIAYGEILSAAQFLDLNPDYPNNSSDPFVARHEYVQKFTGPAESPLYQDIIALTQGTGIINGNFGDEAGQGNPHCPILDTECYFYGSYSATLSVESTIIAVTVDIKPGSDPNSINLCSNGTVPVAILGSDTFNVSNVNTETLRFAEAAVKVIGKKDPYTLCSYEDVNGDYIADLTCHYVTTDIAGIDGESTTATVNGDLLDGSPIQGTDGVNIVKDTCN